MADHAAARIDTMADGFRIGIEPGRDVIRGKVMHLGGMINALRHDDDAVFLAARKRGAQLLHDVIQPLVIALLDLRDQDGFRAGRDAGMHRDVAAAATHNVHDGHAAVGSHGVAQLVDAVHAGVDGGIKADGVIGVGQVVVDGAGQTDDVDVALVLDQARTAVGTVTAADHQALDAALVQVVIALMTNRRICRKLRQTGSAQHRTAAMNDITHVAGRQQTHVVVEQAEVTVLHSVNIHIKIQRRTHHCTDRSVHARSITARGQDCNLFLLSHVVKLSFALE